MNKNTQTVLFVKIHLLRQNNAMQNNSKQLNAWYEVEVEEGGTKMFVFNYFLLCTRGRAAAAGNTQSSHWKCTEQQSLICKDLTMKMQNTQKQLEMHRTTTSDAQHPHLRSAKMHTTRHNTTHQLSQMSSNIFICKDLSEILIPQTTWIKQY